MPEHAETTEPEAGGRVLPASIVIPSIRGEMVRLRPATMDDLPLLDELDAFADATTITGKDRVAERAVVHTWVRRSVAWSQGVGTVESGVGDPEFRRTVAWSMVIGGNGGSDAPGRVIGMIFLIDVDGWSRSARIQVILGRSYRGRGYSRDAMPRVMTYGFAPAPVGLNLHRIWVAVPEKNTRSISVYQSLGFMPSGTSRDALWDAENDKYQDQIVMDTLVDEYDPIRSLDAFGMHIFEDNPGVREAMAAREHSLALQQKRHDGEDEASRRDFREDRRDEPDVAASDAVRRSGHGDADSSRQAAETRRHDTGAHGTDDGDAADDAARRRRSRERMSDHGGTGLTEDREEDETPILPPPDADTDGRSNWPYGQEDRKHSKGAWWRTLGRGRRRADDGR